MALTTALKNTAQRCASYSKSIRPSVRHTLALCQNDFCYNHAVFTGL